MSTARLMRRLTGVVGQLEHIGCGVTDLIRMVKHMTGELETLRAQVATNTSVVASASTLIKGFAARLDAAIASGDPAALTALSAAIKKDDEDLAAAVAANTPAAEPPPA